MIKTPTGGRRVAKKMLRRHEAKGRVPAELSSIRSKTTRKSHLCFIP